MIRSIRQPSPCVRFWRLAATVKTRSTGFVAWTHWLAGAVLAAACALSLLTGCESGGGGGDDADVVGTWSLSGSEGAWYITFDQDSTWQISDYADGTGQRAYGTYSVSGNSVEGPMTNPGTGTGEIAATVDGDAIELDFIEYWHTPYKVVHYSGTRL